MESNILIFILIVGTASAATMFGYEPKKPAHLAHKVGCYIEEVGDVIPYGETITPIGNCIRIHCFRGIIDYATCGVVGTDDSTHCYITDEDLNKPYPSCCPDVKCDLDNNIL